jgi:hypothetical protein
MFGSSVLRVEVVKHWPNGKLARRRRREFLDFMNEVVAANPNDGNSGM